MNRIVISLLCAVAIQLSVYGQGTLTPSAAPAPTMKSLDQIEPRIPISSEEYFIGSPGSYYVTTNLTGANAGNPYGIFIASDDVTVDLNGYTVQGGSGSSIGVFISGSHSNIVIRNGIVTGWGSSGVDWNHPSFPPQNVVLEHLTVSSNGQSGINTANGYTVSDCSVQNNGGPGIALLGNGSVIVGNILAGNNSANGPSSGGIVIEGLNNRIDGNHVTGSGSAGYGIAFNFFGDTNNIIIRNSVSGNGANNYSTAGGTGNDWGPVGTAATSTSPWANISH